MYPLCRSEVEDEFHFSMICDKLKDIRDTFFQKLTVQLQHAGIHKYKHSDYLQ
jgi:hypothetical protein